MEARANQGEKKLSFVLPVALKEKSPSSNPRMSWRHSPDDCVTTRTRLLFASFLKNFKQDDLLDFFIVCPACDVSSILRILASLTHDPRYHVVADGEICPEATKGIHGWYGQQFIKLAISAHISSEYYVTLDSDILCLRPFAYTDLICNNLALTNVETPADYARIYTHEFSLQETANKSSRYRISRTSLGYVRPRALLHRFYGETPVVLHRRSVLELIEYLDTRFQQRWTRTLAGEDGWTEYSLYFQFLEMKKQLESVCGLADCNAVLDLEKSVWHESRHYRRFRSYDFAHFNRRHANSEGGFFVAIQSWLDVALWLPQRCGTLNDFYREVEGWLLDAKVAGQSPLVEKSDSDPRVETH